MTDAKILPAMVQVSNNSHLTKDVAKAITAKLSVDELQDFLKWIDLVKSRIK